MTHYVVGFAFDEDRVHLILKLRPEWQHDKFNGIGGHIEEGERPLDAMVREFKEETGAEVHKWNKFAMMRGPDWTVHCFSAHGVSSLSVRSMTDEQVCAFPWDRLPGNIIPNLGWLVPMARLDGSFATVEYA